MKSIIVSPAAVKPISAHDLEDEHYTLAIIE